MACTIWREMFGNGASIGIGRITMQRQTDRSPTIRKDPSVVSTLTNLLRLKKSSEVVRICATMAIVRVIEWRGV